MEKEAEVRRAETMDRQLEQALFACTVFEKTSRNSAKQRAVVGAAIFGNEEEGCASAWVEKEQEAQKVQEKTFSCFLKVRRHWEGTEEQKGEWANLCLTFVAVPCMLVVGKKNVEGSEEEVFQKGEWKEKTTFFLGSAGHIPALPAVDADKEPGKKRKVEAHVVEGSEHMAIVDHVDGIRVTFQEQHNLFIRLPRGVSLGEGMLGKKGPGDHFLKQLYGVLKMVEDRTSKSDSRVDTEGSRIAVLDGEGSRYVHLGTTAERFVREGKKTKSSMKNLHDKENRKELEIFSTWVNRMQDTVVDYFPSWLKKIVEAFNEKIEQPGLALSHESSDKVWPAMVSGRNVFLNLHTDDDFIWSLVTVVSEHEPTLDSPIVCYFCFPTIGMAVPLRNGDMLLFNPKVPHCVSSRCNGSMDSFCISFYMNSKLGGGNDNSQEISSKEMKDQAAVLKKKKLLKRKSRGGARK